MKYTGQDIQDGTEKHQDRGLNGMYKLYRLTWAVRLHGQMRQGIQGQEDRANRLQEDISTDGTCSSDMTYMTDMYTGQDRHTGHK